MSVDLLEELRDLDDDQHSMAPSTRLLIREAVGEIERLRELDVRTAKPKKTMPSKVDAILKEGDRALCAFIKVKDPNTALA